MNEMYYKREGIEKFKGLTRSTMVDLNSWRWTLRHFFSFANQSAM